MYRASATCAMFGLVGLIWCLYGISRLCWAVASFLVAVATSCRNLAEVIVTGVEDAVTRAAK